MKVNGQRIEEMHLLPRDGMDKGNLERVEELSRESKISSRILRCVRRIRRIAYEGMLRVFHVHADLMCTPREQLTIDEGVTVVA